MPLRSTHVRDFTAPAGADDSRLHSVVAGDSVKAFEGYAITRGRYDPWDALDAVVEAEFGPGAEVADWQEIKARFVGRGREFADELGLPTSQTGSCVGVFLRDSGTHVDSSSSCNYRVSRCEGLVGETRDRLDGTLCLTCCTGLKAGILVRMPQKQ